MVPRLCQWVGPQDRLSPTASGFQQTVAPIALKACKTKSLEGGNDNLACEENPSNF